MASASSDLGHHERGDFRTITMAVCGLLSGAKLDQSALLPRSEPIREVWIHSEAFAASRLSMMRIMARRMNAATVVA